MNKNEKEYYAEFPSYDLLMKKLGRFKDDKVSYFDFIEEILPRQRMGI